ncbi:MAG TPA: type II secretion system protein GspM [Gammaproteobacteria bacterium]|nr:type II secretion system protein GspM [Gammaproteobacteria bacterium]
MANVAQTMARIDALPGRERALLFGAAALLLAWLWDVALWQPLSQQRVQAMENITQTQNDIVSAEQQASDIEKRGIVDPDADNKSRMAQLRAQIDEVRQQLAQDGSQLVPPEKMAEVLQTMISKSGKLSLIALNSLGTSPLGPAALLSPPANAQPGTTNPAPAAPPAVAYRHGLRLEFSGPYLDMLEYLRTLESLPWKFLWGAVEYEVSEYPQAKGAIIVYTVSLAPAWIGT